MSLQVNVGESVDVLREQLRAAQGQLRVAQSRLDEQQSEIEAMRLAAVGDLERSQTRPSDRRPTSDHATPPPRAPIRPRLAHTVTPSLHTFSSQGRARRRRVARALRFVRGVVTLVAEQRERRAASGEQRVARRLGHVPHRLGGQV